MTRSTFEVYRNLPRQVGKADKCKSMAREMNGWSHSDLKRAGYNAQEISDWDWTLGILHRMAYSNGGSWEMR